MTPNQVESLARATCAHGLIQAALYFPQVLPQLGVSQEQALAQALGLAEEAVALAPELPDGHVALGRLILCHQDDEAVDDAVELLRHALSLEPEHDPAQVGVASALLARSQDEEALRLVETVIRRGNPLPQPLLLRALIHFRAGRTVEARRDVERAVQLAPGVGLLRVEASRIASVQGDDEGAQEHLTQARDLLGEETTTALLGEETIPSQD